jgi:lipopolysaccharide export system protein LptA
MAYGRSMMLLTALFLMSAPAGAQQSDVRVWRPDPSQDASVHIDSDELAVNDAQKTATFSGNVRVSQGETHLRCSQARVWYRAVAPGRGATVDHLECQQ